MPRFLTRTLIISLVACLAFVSVSSDTRLTLASSPHIRLNHNVGSPSTYITVSGKGFGINETVSINFDTTPVGIAATNNTGAFHAKIMIPTSALPGTHTILATGNTSGLNASTSFLVQTDWTTFGFNQHLTHFNPYENVLNSSNVTKLVLDWQYTTGNTIVSSPAIVNGVVYIGSDDGNIYALNAATGTPIWSYSTGYGSYCRCVNSSPSVVNGIVYIGAGDGKLYALNATSGSLIWAYTASDMVQTPVTVVNGVVYFGSNDDNLYAVNATTGAHLWNFTTGGAILFAPAVAKGVVYVGSEDNNLYALNATSGVLLWTVNTGASILSPAVVNGLVYVGAFNIAYAFNAKTGTTIWSSSLGKITMINTPPAVANGVAYFGTENGDLYAFNAKTGITIWSYSTKDVFDSLAVANGIVYAGAYNGNGLYVFNASNGTLLWTYLDPYGFTSTVVVNGVIYVGSYDKNVYAFHLPG